MLQSYWNWQPTLSCTPSTLRLLLMEKILHIWHLTFVFLFVLRFPILQREREGSFADVLQVVQDFVHQPYQLRSKFCRMRINPLSFQTVSFAPNNEMLMLKNPPGSSRTSMASTKRHMELCFTRLGSLRAFPLPLGSIQRTSCAKETWSVTESASGLWAVWCLGVRSGWAWF